MEQPPPAAALRSRVQEWDDAAWCLAALALACRADTAAELRDRGRDVLVALDLWDPTTGAPSGSTVTPEQLGGRAAAPLLEIAAVLSGSTAWTEQSEAALLAVGTQSSVLPGFLASAVLPATPGLGERLSTPGARILDVGTGVAGMALAFAHTFPHASVLGIDVFDRALDLARRRLSVAADGERVALRRQSVAELDDEQVFDLAWVPAPFVPEPALRQGATRVARALRPGGWLVLGHAQQTGDPVRAALARLRTAACGGTFLDGQAARDLLVGAGLTDVAPVPTPVSAPALVLGRRPA